jgi:hypothetical protein
MLLSRHVASPTARERDYSRRGQDRIPPLHVIRACPSDERIPFVSLLLCYMTSGRVYSAFPLDIINILKPLLYRALTAAPHYQHLKLLS